IPIPWSLSNELLKSAPARPSPMGSVGTVPPSTKPVAIVDGNAIRREEIPRGNVIVGTDRLLQPEHSHASTTASVPANVIATEVEASAESIAREPARMAFAARVWLPIIALVWVVGALLLLV